MWDLETGRELRTLASHSDAVVGAALSCDERRAVSASKEKPLKVWDLVTGAVLAAFTCDAPALCCGYTGDRRMVAGDASGRVHFLSPELEEGK
jgi:WD40 repeat protein